MTILNGMEVNKQIRKPGIQIPVLALSTNHLKDVEEGIAEPGGNGFILKPFDHIQLRKTLETYWQLG